MGTIISSIGAIENVIWSKLRKGHVTKCKSVLLVRDDGVAIVELENGSFTVIGRHHSPNGNWAVLGYGLDDFTQSVLHGLVKLGILNSKQVKDHIATADERKKALERKQSIRRLEEICKELGVDAPKVE